MYSYILLKCFTLFWWYELACARWCELAQERMCMMISPNPQPVVVGPSIRLCLHPLHQCLQLSSSNCWHRWMLSCKVWQQLMSIRQDNQNVNSLKSPPTLTSWQPNLQSSSRWQTRLKLITGFTSLSQSLDCFTILSFRRPYLCRGLWLDLRVGCSWMWKTMEHKWHEGLYRFRPPGG
jgi:hypothetical protein